MGIFSIALQAALGFAKAVVSAKKGNLKTSVSLTKKTKDGKTTLKSMDELVYEVVQSAYGNYIRGKTTTMARFVGHPAAMLSPIEQLKLTMELYEPKIKCLIQENTTKKEEDIDVLDRIKEVGISYYSSYLKGLAGEQVIDKKYTLENLFTGKLTSEDMPDAITLLNMVAATKGAYYRGMYNGIKGIWDGGKMLVTETDKVLEGIYQSGSEFLEAPLKNTWEFLGDIKDGFIDSVWRSTPQEIAEDAGELAFDVAISVPTGGAGKVVSGAAKGIGKIKYLDNLVDIGKISQKIPSLQGMPLPAGEGFLTPNLVDDFLKAPYQMIKPDGEDVAKLTAKGGEIAKEALPDGKDVAQQAKNSFIKDAAKAMPVVEGVKGAEKVADNTPDRKNTPNTSKTDKTEGGENQKPANESGNDKKTTNEKDKTEGENTSKEKEKTEEENTSKEKNSSDETEGRKVTREENGGKNGSGVETSGEVKETKVEDLKEKIDDNDAVQDVLEGPRYSQERRISDALYKKLRKKTPSPSIRKMVNEGVDFRAKDPALPGIEVEEFQADHIVPMNNIVRMEGFEKLTFKQQLEVLNNPKNFIGLSEAANKSKKEKSYSEWTHYKKGTPEEIKVDETFRQEMIKKEKELEKILQKQIDDLVEKNSKGE